MAKKQTSLFFDLPEVNIRYLGYNQLMAMPAGGLTANFWAMLLMDASEEPLIESDLYDLLRQKGFGGEDLAKVRKYLLRPNFRLLYNGAVSINPEDDLLKKAKDQALDYYCMLQLNNEMLVTPVEKEYTLQKDRTAIISYVLWEDKFLGACLLNCKTGETVAFIFNQQNLLIEELGKYSGIIGLVPLRLFSVLGLDHEQVQFIDLLAPCRQTLNSITIRDIIKSTIGTNNEVPSDYNMLCLLNKGNTKNYINKLIMNCNIMQKFLNYGVMHNYVIWKEKYQKVWALDVQWNVFNDKTLKQILLETCRSKDTVIITVPKSPYYSELTDERYIPINVIDEVVTVETFYGTNRYVNLYNIYDISVVRKNEVLNLRGAEFCLRVRPTGTKAKKHEDTMVFKGTQTLDDVHTWIFERYDLDYDFDYYHLYAFYMSGRLWDSGSKYIGPYTDDDMATTAQLCSLGLKEGAKFIYVYDFGNEYVFNVWVDKIVF